MTNVWVYESHKSMDLISQKSLLKKFEIKVLKNEEGWYLMKVLS